MTSLVVSAFAKLLRATHRAAVVVCLVARAMAMARAGPFAAECAAQMPHLEERFYPERLDRPWRFQIEFAAGQGSERPSGMRADPAAKLDIATVEALGGACFRCQ